MAGLAEAAGWLADGALPPAARVALDRARPSALVVAPDTIAVSFGGFVAEPARLAAACELVASFAAAQVSPYR